LPHWKTVYHYFRFGGWMAPGSGFTMNCAAMPRKRLGENGNRALPSSTASRSRPRKRGAARLRCWQEDQWPQTPSARRCSWVGACCRRPSGRCSGPRWCASGVGSASAHLHTPTIDLADGGYAGQLLAGFGNLRGRNRLKMEIVKRTDDVRGFKVLRADGLSSAPSAGLGAAPSQQGLRVLPATSETIIYITMIGLMIRRLFKSRLVAPPSTEQAATDTRRWGSQPHPQPSPDGEGSRKHRREATICSLSPISMHAPVAKTLDLHGASPATPF